MFFFNLSFAEFMTLFTAASGLVFALYLLNRSRRKQIVSTLRFWRTAERPVAIKHRRRIQQPWSLLLQLISIALLLLAIAQIRIGSPDPTSRDHVLLLDTSAWMAAKGKRGTLLDEAKASAKAYVRALPSTDRVMLVRADGLSTPATGLEASRDVVINSIDQSRPSAAALNLEQALSFAMQVQKLNSLHAGEIVFAGAGRVSEADPTLQHTPSANLRLLPVAQNVENCGLRKIGLRRSPVDPGLWQAFVAVRNYGTMQRNVPVVLQFGGAPVGTRVLSLAPGTEQETTFQFRTKAAGYLEARLLIEDALAEDNRAILEMPAQKPLKVAVFTDQPELLRPVLAANSLVDPVFLPPSAYQPNTNARIVIFDRFRPKDLPNAGVIWIEPPGGRSPIPIRTVVHDAPVLNWKSDHELGTGLRTKQLRLESSQVFSTIKGDIAVAEVEAGPVVVARPGSPRVVAIGFHPGRSAMKFDLATPLLFANILRWMEPEVFRKWELNAASVGTVTVPLESEAETAHVRVTTDGQQLPFTVHGRSVQFFAGMPGTVRVITDSGEQVFSLTLPEVGEAVWQPPASARHGIPTRSVQARARDLWQLLAILGGAGLLAEWLLFGRARGRQPQPLYTAGKTVLRKAS
jgi:hypothetical protein